MEVGGKKPQGPYFLRRVLQEEAKKLLVTAVHAVFSETGFVGCEYSSSRRRVNEWPAGWASTTISRSYTLPELLRDQGSHEFVELRFQSSEDFLNVYGSLQGRGGSRKRAIYLNVRRFGSVMDSVWANGAEPLALRGGRDVFEFWELVEVGLARPLLFDLRDRCGLGPPPCLMVLPVDVKLKILESLPGVAVASLGCACVEMNHLCSNNDLWKHKFAQEFGSIALGDVGSGTMVNWKRRFALSWKARKRRKTSYSSFDLAERKNQELRAARRR